ncbi:MAG: hypothetical protein HY676_00715 [Chloroflexi bacterium]|nr:hypothetical protein [Chloroflexota bacterium]
MSGPTTGDAGGKSAMEIAVKVGEVIEARTEEFQAESATLHQPPPLGSLIWVREGEIDIYAVTGSAATGSREPGRQAVALGQDEEELPQAYPQLSKLLRTTFVGLVVGYQEKGELRHYLPPRPVRLHNFVYLCPSEEAQRFTRSLDFLSLLAAQRQDEALGACLRLVSHVHPNAEAFLVGAGRELVPLLAGDVGRLHALLRRLRP